MIDLEFDIFTALATRLRTEYPGIFVSGEYVPAPPSFPAVSIVESDNRVVEDMRTLNIENAALVMYEVQIYSAKVNGKKAEAKEIAETVDAFLTSIGFTRTMKNQVPNMNDATIYRIVCRYEAIIDKDFWIYQN